MNFYNDDFNAEKWKDLFRDPINTDRVRDMKPEIIDCGELIEVNGEYVPAQ